MLKVFLVLCGVVIVLPLSWLLVSFFYPDILLRPEPAGLCEGRLPNKPNWVSSKVSPSDSHYIQPLPDFDKQTLMRCVKALPPKRTTIEHVGEHYQGVRRTSFFGFADWFCISEKGDITSSATLGHSDLGVNRQWVEALRDCLKKE